ncbi:MarR family winged helix-turn-helix transcriptional regulator [Knoellia sp. p5-6-4]|uniref:MarR family winged helix-turn-helix transcriptional regulator n=1 Tax=unclassified Knoellia TaxID=2618719 RepID=UPI0023DBBC0D|nr:MarR family transcriptional regulator [Knoellia sp. p5-6-4]MDF2144932.1 MarR family transcriptional regulator [Knoellia sp. p5-6-4]
MAITIDAASTFSVTMVRVIKLIKAMRQNAPSHHPGLDASAYPLLFTIASGPRRVSELADCVHSDVSTVSRQASSLVVLGVARKVTDPDDGRAQVITITPEGEALLEAIKAERSRWFQSLLADWTSEEVAEFTAYLDRFGDALEASRTRASVRSQGTAPTTDPSQES